MSAVIDEAIDDFTTVRSSLLLTTVTLYLRNAGGTVAKPVAALGNAGPPGSGTATSRMAKQGRSDRAAQWATARQPKLCAARIGGTAACPTA
jgi:hypothetical protein